VGAALNSVRMPRGSPADRPAFFTELTAICCRITDGQVSLTHSVSAGLDYALVGPEHAWLRDQGRTEYVSATDQEALEAARTLAHLEGIIPALESAHAVAEAVRRAPASKDQLFVINLSGRGDKDTDIYREN